MNIEPQRKKKTRFWKSWESLAKNWKFLKKENHKRYSLGNYESVYGSKLERNREILCENSSLECFYNLEIGENSGVSRSIEENAGNTLENYDSDLENVTDDESSNGNLNKKLHEPETMTAQITSNTPFIHLLNAQLSKDVPDNGTAATALLTKNLQKIQTGLILRNETERLKTFKNWPNKRIEPQKLAAAGFYYLGKADIVECFECGIKGHNWVEHDQPMDDHMKWNRNCPFVVRQNDASATASGGAATEHDNAQQAASQPRLTTASAATGRDICGNLSVEILPNSETEDGNVETPQTSLKNYVIQNKNGPSHLDQITYETRLATFENWPKSLKQKPAELAAAGFYYLGVGDQTLCFHCGGGLKDWVEDDDPWEQHALWFPKCVFLILKKGQEFVEAVQTNKHKPKNENNAQEQSQTASVAAAAACSAPTTKEIRVVETEATNEVDEKKSQDSAMICKICFENKMGVLFLPCGHIVACVDCATALKKCAVCRKNIQATVRAFLQ